MARFLIIFFSLYSAMHALFYFRIRVLFADRRWPNAAVVVFLILMAAAPLVSRLLERNDHEAAARYVALVGFNWMGFIFLAVCIAFPMLFVDIFLRALNHIAGLQLPLLAGRLPALGLIGCALLLCGYGYLESRTIRIERIRIETDKLPVGTARLKIIQISDLHLGLLAGNGRLKPIMENIQAERPDILVSTGDLVDGRAGDFAEIVRMCSRIPTRYGKYAVTGNHEYYAGLESALAITQAAGFHVLRGRAATASGVLNIVGVDDADAALPDREGAVLSTVKNGLFTLLLKHRPWIFNRHLDLFDLQLSGHTHGGQVFPFNYLVKLQYPLPTGYLELNKKAKLYTSRGTGTWGPRMRILSPPEITVFELLRKTDALDQRPF